MKCNCCIVHKIAGLILVIGGINLGIIGAFQFDLIDAVFETWSIVRVVYILVGLSALSMPIMMFCKKCKGGDCCTELK